MLKPLLITIALLLSLWHQPHRNYTGQEVLEQFWVASPAPNKPSLVQSNSNELTCASSTTATLASQPAAGDLIVIYAQMNNTTFTLTPPTGFAQEDTHVGSTFQSAEFYKVASGSEGTSYVIGSNCTSNVLTYVVADVKNENQVSPFDQHNTTITATTGVSTFSTASLTPSQSNDLPIAVIAPGAVSTLPITSTTPATWTQQELAPGFSMNMYFGPNQSTSAVSFSETTSGTNSYEQFATLDLIAGSIGSSASPYNLSGCGVYTANDWFTTNLITGGSSYAVNTVDPNSAAIIANFDAANGNPTFIINGATAAVVGNTPNNPSSYTNLTFYTNNGCSYGCKNDPPYNDEGGVPSSCTSGCAWAMPWNTSFILQGSCPTGGDCHGSVEDTTHCLAYDAYGQTSAAPYNSSLFSGSGWWSESAYVHNLNHSWNSQMNGGPNAAGIPMIGTYLFGEDASQPSINHAIEVSIPGNGASPIASGAWVAPATAHAGSCASSCTNQLPLGARLRLKQTYTCPSAVSHAQANRVCVAMQTYGIIVVDYNGAGSGYFGTNIGTSATGSNPWSTDLSVLDGIPLTDFDLMTLGTEHL